MTTSVPPGDLDSRALPIATLDIGTELFRIHESAYDYRYFGRLERWRFDDPARTYGVLYAATTPQLAFAETLLRGPAGIVAESELAIRSLSTFRVARPLNLVQLHGPALSALDADASATSGPYDASRRWSAAIHAHPERPDGIVYRGTRDNDRLAVALFERASADLSDAVAIPLLDDLLLLGGLLDHYGAGLV